MDAYENHGAFNKHLSVDGFRVNTSGTKPSIYITQVKLKRALKELSDFDIEEILDNEMSDKAILKEREKIMERIAYLQDWQLIMALNILISEGRIEAITYVVNCKENDKEPN